MINLRSISQSGESFSQSDEQSPPFSTLGFRVSESSFLGNIGENLELETEAEDGFEEDQMSEDQERFYRADTMNTEEQDIEVVS
jgi:hypothetical protein